MHDGGPLGRADDDFEALRAAVSDRDDQAPADHLLRRRSDATYAANIIAAWSERYLP